VAVNHTTDYAAHLSDGVGVTWTGIGNGVQGDACGGPYVTASFQVTGTFGVAGSIIMQGSNDNVNWFNLSPPALTAAGIFAALGAAEHPRYIRPSVTAGDGTTALTVVGFLSQSDRT
jgi:hypothetical protein